MTTAREALVKEGLAKPSRGKFSFAAHEWLQKQIANGVSFSDYPKDNTKVKGGKSVSPKPTGRKETKAPSEVMSDYVFPSEYRFPEATYKAVNDKGQAISMREVCNTCRVSLVAHGCASPTIHGSIPVTVLPKGKK